MGSVAAVTAAQLSGACYDSVLARLITTFGNNFKFVVHDGFGPYYLRPCL